MFDPKTYLHRINLACTIVDVILLVLLVLSFATSYVAYHTALRVKASTHQQASPAKSSVNIK